MPTSIVRWSIVNLLLLLFTTFPTVAVIAQATPPNPQPVAPIDTIRVALEAEQKRTMDPALGRVPYERLGAVQNELQLNAHTPSNATTNGIPGVTWQERGPSNAGGRTRAFLFDPNDSSHKKVWAGSVSGGLWFNPDVTNASSSWTTVSDDWANRTVTALAADPSNPQIMYAGTGDIYDYRSGGGIWKTTDGGQSWSRLTSTIPGGSFPAVGTALYYIQRIVVNSSGHIFVATQYGVVKSTDGGTSWAYTLAPAQNIGVTGTSTDVYNDQVSDLEIGTDGAIYAAFYPSKVYKSTNGTTWTDITPAGAPIGGRTELALASSTSGASQVIYAVTRKYNSTNYNQDILWFKKSSNGGTTWTDIQIPASGSTNSYHFTSGIGYYAMSLAVHPTNPNAVYAGGTSWYTSTDGGASWTQIITDFNYNHGLAFQPGNPAAAVPFSEKGIDWSANWSTATQPTLANRNAGYRAGETNSVAMKSSAGSSYLLNTTFPLGGNKITQANLASGLAFYPFSHLGTAFIDDEDPTLQIFSQYGSYYLYNGTSWSSLFSVIGASTINPTDYDSPANIIYAVDYVNSAYAIRRVAGIGATLSTTSLPLTGFTSAPSFIKLSRDRATLFVGNYPGKLYKITGLDQASPTLTAIDNSAFPQYTTVSGIEVGATTNELIVILSNYGVKSVWYTSNGGTTWTSKDEASYGLPDIPVRSVLVNPQNYKQVMLGTEVGVWSSNDITANNPDWSFSNAGLANIQVNQLRYRASDGQVAAATTGRGVFVSNIFAIPYTLPVITLTGVSTTSLCSGSTFSVSFTTSGPAFAAGNQFEVWLSDANGSFTNAQRIGTGSTSPVSATLPSGYSALAYGTNYRVKIIALNPDVESGQSDALDIGNLANAGVNDRRSDVFQYYSSGQICVGGQASLRTFGYTITTAATTPESYTWLLNNTVISGATSATYSAQQAGTYTAIVKQGGCTVTSNSYILSTTTNIYTSVISASYGEPQCDDRPLKLSSNYVGENASYQWTRDGSDIAGATSYTFAATQTGAYAHRLVDGSCATTASPVYFQFGRSLYARAYMNSAVDSLLCSSSSYGSFIYADLPSSNGYTIQWYRNGTALTGNTANGYWASQPGIYTFQLQQGTCQTMSNAIVLSDINQIAASISYGFRSKSVCPGESRYLYAKPINGTFQWQKDGIDIAGATNSSYAATQSGNYTVRITKGSCSATSAPVSLTFSNAIKPVADFSESCSGVSLSVSDNYNLAGYQYQWFKNGTPVNGVTTSYYYATQSGVYTVQVTNGSCTGSTKDVYVNIGQKAKPIISASPTSQLCNNNTVRLTIPYNVAGTLQWKRNGLTITGGNNNEFYATQSGFYMVVVQDGSCQVESDAVDIRIGETTTATLSGSALVSSGQAALLPVVFSGPAPWSFTLSNGQSVTATYQNPYLVSVLPTSTTTYQLTSVLNACGFGSTAGQASVTLGTGSADVSLAMSVSNRAPKVGEVVSYTLNAANAGPQDATGVKLQSRLPTGLSFVNAITPGVSFANGIVSADVGTITANNRASVIFQLTPTQPGTFATAAQLTASQTPDPDSQPNSGTGDGQDDAVTADLRTSVTNNTLTTSPNPDQLPLPNVVSNQPTSDPATADLSLSMGVDKVIIQANQNDVVTSTIKVSNRGGSTANSVVVIVTFPNGSFAPQNSASWIQVNNQTYKIYINKLASGQSSSVSIRWQLASAGILKAQILDMAETDSDSTPGNGYTNGEDDEAIVSIRER